MHGASIGDYQRASSGGIPLTKKHFIRAAEIVRSLRPESAPIVANSFVRLFEEFNPRFDHQRFLIACGLIDAPVKPKRMSRT
jgi:hypothetical protein